MDIKKMMNESPSSPLIQDIGTMLNNLDALIKHITPEDKATITITLAAPGYSSKCSAVPLDFSGLTDQVEIAYINKVDYENAKFLLEKGVVTQIAAGEGVFLYNKTNGPLTIEVPIASAFTEPIRDNMLTGLLKDFPVINNKAIPPGHCVYVLSSANGQMAKAVSGTIVAGKTILIIPEITV